MGITSSTKSNSRSVRILGCRFPWDKIVWEELGSDEEHEGVLAKEIDAIAKDTTGMMIKELDALLPQKLGEPSTNKPKEGDTEWEEQIFMRFKEFMIGGGCKESFKVLDDCVEKTQSIPKCNQPVYMLFKCMDAHSRYYQPIISLAESCMEQILKEMEELSERKQSEE